MNGFSYFENIFILNKNKMNLFVQIWLITLFKVAHICCECDVCQSTNSVACHEENIYSLCVNGSPTNDFITCPENHKCTADPYVCYPIPEAKPSCERHTNLCGVCSKNKVYACTNETTIAFCYGEDKPVKSAEVSYCLGDTVCDIFSEKGFCTESFLVKPSCVPQKALDRPIKFSTDTTTTEFTTMATSTTIQPTTSSAAKQPAKVTSTATTATISRPATIETFVTASLTTTTTTTGTTTMKKLETSTESTTKATTVTMETTLPTNQLTTTKTATEETATTTASTVKTTTPSGPATPDEICNKNAITGSFSAEDPECTTFVICYMKNRSLTGLKKKCRENQYFSPELRRCSSKKPDVCL